MGRSVADSTPAARQPPKQTRVTGRVNWPLIVGCIVVLFVVLIVIAGPALAPRDPLERQSVLKIGDRFYGPPFPAFATSEYPLGSDLAGRDLFSRLLWGVRPTMLLVVVVATVRTLLGMAIGLVSGWSLGFAGRALRALTAGALAVPIVLVALGAIAAVGFARGLPAFIIGLSLTGWAETAQLVSTQARLLREQPFIQAARALGASGFHVLVRHILRHILPLAGMLFAFEISATLMITAALGFLGYFIGGGVWVELDDRVTRNFAELPELGQMLSSALIQLTKPGPMIAIGTTIFLIILGFNLLGEGLRRALQHTHSPSRLMRAVGRFEGRLEEAILVRAAQWSRGTIVRGALAILLIGGATGAVVWLRGRSAAAIAPSRVQPAVALAVPGGQWWASERHDAQGTLWSSAQSLKPTPEIAWVFTDNSGFAGGPVVAADRTVYVASTGGTLYALEPVGTTRWQAQLAATPIGAPALGPDGTIYVVDQGGGLSAVTPDGKQQWRFQSHSRHQGTSGPVVGPDGTIYYTLIDSVQAVTPDGRSLWLTSAVDGYLEIPPRVSPTGDLVFLQNAAFNARDGSRQQLGIGQAEPQFVQTAYLVGAGGQLYYCAGNSVTEWRATDAGGERLRTIEVQDHGVRISCGNLGVTLERRIWTFNARGFAGGTMIWLDQNGLQIGSLDLRQQRSRVIAVDASSTAYICGSRTTVSGECAALSPTASKPIWQVPLEQSPIVTGGALVPGRLYVATQQRLYALGSGLSAE